jgi:hypothetical protein
MLTTNIPPMKYTLPTIKNSITTPLLYQTDLQGNTLEKDDLKAFGDTIGKKVVNVFRIMLQNLNNLPTSVTINHS